MIKSKFSRIHKRNYSLNSSSNLDEEEIEVIDIENHNDSNDLGEGLKRKKLITKESSSTASIRINPKQP